MASARIPTVLLAVVDAALLLLAAVLAAAVWVELRDPHADPLTGIGYVIAGGLAVLALVSLLLVWLSTLSTGAWRVVCLVLAVVPLLPVALWCLATAW